MRGKNYFPHCNRNATQNEKGKKKVFPVIPPNSSDTKENTQFLASSVCFLSVRSRIFVCLDPLEGYLSFLFSSAPGNMSQPKINLMERRLFIIYKM